MTLPWVTTVAGFLASILALLIILAYPGPYPLSSITTFFIIEFSVVYGYFIGVAVAWWESR